MVGLAGRLDGLLHYFADVMETQRSKRNRASADDSWFNLFLPFKPFEQLHGWSFNDINQS